MGIADTNKELPSNKLIFELRRDPDLRARFNDDMEAVFAEWSLGENEIAAWRDMDIKGLSALGVHPYFLPQIARLFKGAGYNHNRSDAARLYADKMLKSED